MDQALVGLVRAEEIDPEHAFLVAKDKSQIKPFLRESDDLGPLLEL